MAIEYNSYRPLLSYGYEDLLCLSYPDVLVKDLDLIPEAPNGAAVAKRHGWPHRVPDTHALLLDLGYEPTYIDIIKESPRTRLVDLNVADSFGRFDVILDPGTTEHCFNIGNVFKFIHESLNPNGLVIHTNPCSQINHGFWNLNPGTYVDFYRHLGYEILELAYLHGPLDARQRIDIPPDQAYVRHTLPVPEVVLFCVARKTQEVPFSWPTQRKYQKPSAPRGNS